MKELTGNEKFPESAAENQKQPVYPPTPYIHHLTFRSSKIIYYGPHACSNCGVLICKMGTEFGGNAFNYPNGPIYPNTEWHPHVCDPKRVVNIPKPAVLADKINPQRTAFDAFTVPAPGTSLSS